MQYCMRKALADGPITFFHEDDLYEQFTEKYFDYTQKDVLELRSALQVLALELSKHYQAASDESLLDTNSDDEHDPLLDSPLPKRSSQVPPTKQYSKPLAPLQKKSDDKAQRRTAAPEHKKQVQAKKKKKTKKKAKDDGAEDSDKCFAGKLSTRPPKPADQKAKHRKISRRNKNQPALTVNQMKDESSRQAAEQSFGKVSEFANMVSFQLLMRCTMFAFFASFLSGGN